MKRCPQCNRVEYDDALAFCRIDGAALVRDSSSPISEAGTAKLGSTATESETSLLPHKTGAAMNRSTVPTAGLPAKAGPRAPGGDVSKPGYPGPVVISVAL